MNASDYLVQIEKLTNTNLKILNALNESFKTDQSYVSVDLGEGGVFNVPAFLTLENKINSLQNNFENLVKSPITGEAHFIFSGDSRTIELKRYEQAPAPIVLDAPENFYHENNNILKDFLTPVPYVKFDIKDSPNDISSFVVRKVSAISSVARERFANILGDNTSVRYNWGDLYKVISDLEQDKDYVMYDTTQKTPVREGQGDGVYVIKSIDDNYVDENLDQHVVLTFWNKDFDNETYRKDLTYLLFDRTIEKDLQEGDYLVAFDGHAKYQIEKLNFESNTIQLRIMYGEYINLTAWSGEGDIDETSKIRFFSNTDLFSEKNYIKVPLEEDQYIYIAIAALNDRMNIRSSWGDGVVLNTNGLTTIEPNGDTPIEIGFRSYYENCRNIGDILNEISKVMGNTTTAHSNDELNDYMNAKPTIDTDIVKVIHINKHLDDSTTIKNIRALYSQKNNYNADLTEVQTSLTALQEQLSSIDFEDTTGIRTKIQNQINELTKQKNELINSLSSISNEIALTANNSVIPIENAKYRIRGFFDFKDFVSQWKDDENHTINEGNIKGIYVQYRYRNIQLETGIAETFTKDTNSDGEIDSTETFVYSDWNQLPTRLRLRVRDENGNYVPEEDTSNKNLPSFNQVDIPITQGENVDVRLKVIYDFGYPFIQMMSAWSDIVTFEFPIEFLKDVDITTILEENNNDIETNRFNDILTDNGITKHVDDSILDQDVTFFHKPENISSGFYTPERRIIPLRDKLKTMDDTITRIVDEIEGTTSEDLSVYIDYDESSILLSPFEVGNIMMKGYSSFNGNEKGQVGNYYYYGADGKVGLMCDIRLVNTSSHSLKIFSLFPGTENKSLNNLTHSKFKLDEFCENVTEPETHKYSVFIQNPIPSGNKLNPQTTNQILTFRIKNPYDGTEYYDSGNTFNKPNKLSYDNDDDSGAYIKLLDNSIDASQKGMAVYPVNVKTDGLLMTYKEATSYMLLNPGDEYVFPFMVEYRLADSGVNSSIEKTISFDIRTSLYSDPFNYTLKIGAKYAEEAADKLVSALNKRYSSTALANKQYNPILQ